MKIKKKYLIAVFLIVILAISSYFGYPYIKKLSEPKKVHYHAGLVLFVEDKKQDFSSFQYMNVRPCTLYRGNEEVDSDQDIQIEKAHLHDNVGDVVHVEREGGTWDDLFKNIRYDINYNNAVAILNGKEIKNFKSLRIKPYDSIIIFEGKNNISKHLSEGVTRQYIMQKEKKSDDCGS